VVDSNERNLHKALELVYRSLDPALQAEVRRQALIIYRLFSVSIFRSNENDRTEGRALIPELKAALSIDPL
jgi:hypothetical protein